MTEAQIKSFLTAAELGSFSRAAESMFVSQPAVSKQVLQLEAELGFPLFDRGQGGLTMTAAGSLLRSYFQKQREDISAVLRDAERLSRTQNSHVNVGLLGAWNLGLFMPKLKKRLAERGYHMSVTVSGYTFDTMAEALKTGNADVVISLYYNLLDYPEIPSKKLTVTGGILVFAPDHPLARKPGLSVSDFADELFFSISEPAGYRNTSRHLRQCCNRYGFDPKMMNLHNLSEALIKVQAGEGCLLVDDWMLAGYTELFGVLHTDDSFEIGAAWLSDGRNPAKHDFIRELCAVFDRDEP